MSLFRGRCRRPKFKIICHFDYCFFGLRFGFEFSSFIFSHPPSTAVPYWRYWRTGYAEKEDGLNTYICYIIIDNKYFVQCILVLLLIRRVRLGPCRAISAVAVSPGCVCQVSLVSHVPAFLLPRSHIPSSLEYLRDGTYPRQ